MTTKINLVCSLLGPIWHLWNTEKHSLKVLLRQNICHDLSQQHRHANPRTDQWRSGKRDGFLRKVATSFPDGKLLRRQRLSRNFLLQPRYLPGKWQIVGAPRPPGPDTSAMWWQNARSREVSQALLTAHSGTWTTSAQSPQRWGNRLQSACWGRPLSCRSMLPGETEEL